MARRAQAVSALSSFSSLRVTAYLVAMAAPLMALAVYWAFPGLKVAPLTLFMAAVVVTAAFGGARPALLAAVLSVVFANYFVLPSDRFLFAEGAGLGLLATLVVTAVLAGRLSSERLRAELARVRSEDRFHTIITDAPIPILVHTVDGEVLSVSRALTRLTGYAKHEIPTAKEWLRKTCRLREGEPLDAAYALFQTKLRAVAPSHKEEQTIHTKSGEKRCWIIHTSQPQPLENGRLVTATMGVDITELKHGEQALRASERRFRDLAESIPHLVWATDAAGRVTYCNRKTLEFGGKTLDEMCAVSWLDCAVPEDRQTAQAAWREALRTGTECRVEVRLLSAGDGKGLWHVCHGVPVGGTEGEVASWFVTGTNVHDRRLFEEELRGSEERFRNAFEHAAIGMVLTDLERRFLYVNPAYCRIVGYSAEELLDPQIDFAKLTYPDDVSNNLEEHRRMIAGEIAAFFVEKRYIRKDGSVVWVRASATVRRDAEGRPLHVVGLVEDITPRKLMEQELRALNEKLEDRVAQRTRELVQSQEALRESERRFRALFNQTFQFIGLLTPEGILVEANQTSLDFIGARREDVIGKPFWETPWWDTSEDLSTQIREAVARAMHGELVRLEVKHRGHDGRIIVVDFSVTPYRDENGNVALLIPEGRDITERLMAAEALRESQERLGLALHSAGMGSWDFDLRNETVVGDEAFCRLFGRERDWFPRPYREFVATCLHPDDRERVGRAIRHAARMGKPLDVEARAILPNGEARDVEARGNVLMDSQGAPVRMTGVCWDVTQAKRTQERLRQSERLAALGQVAAGIGHESRNNLQRTLVCLEMLGKRLKDDPALLHLVSEAVKAQNELRMIFEEVREFTAPAVLERAEEDVAAVWREAWSNLEAHWQGRDARLTEFVDTDPTCYIDAFRLRQVFRNLFENSLAACSDPAEIRVHCEAVSIEGRDAVRVTLADNGQGVGPGELQRIFDPFYTTKPKGTGLGLPIVRRIIESHGGRIEAASEPGKGLRIAFYLPRKGSAARKTA